MPDALPLLRQHYDEIAWRKDVIKFDPDLERYSQLEKADRLRIYTARHDGILIGYAIFVITQHLHYRATKQAVNDVFYVEPTMRGAMVGQRLLVGFAEPELKKEGVHVIHLHIKTLLNWQKLAERWGYEHTDVMMCKFLGD